ncbi:MAG: phosphoenolpyruvate synthase [Candidatus Schekmanbacteria bacterium]|nr:phosphoenolpyruvate synthase [Candidatus Schekmanbacteria bacterium]
MIYDLGPGSRPQVLRRRAGGKGYNLALLAEAGFCVPDFAILSSRAFGVFVAAHRLDREIDRLLAPVRAAGAVELRAGDDIHRQIEVLFLGAAMPVDIAGALARMHEQLAPERISVRSSAAGEDSFAYSFAGQLSSYLYLASMQEVLDAVRKCWASAYSGRSLAYRLENGIGLDAIEVAVVLQKMIDPDASGIAFTRDVISGDPDRMVISAVYGVGEGIVSGALDADTYFCARDLGSVRSEVGEKTSRYARDAANPGRCHEVAVDAEAAARPVLDAETLKLVAETCLRIERFYRFPQDIEFALKNGQLFILQSRPITTGSRRAGAREGAIQIWDNSNIVESYSGVTAPLTFSFASWAYEQVYVQLCEVMGVSRKRIESNSRMFRNMLGLIDGHVYYNLVNWYRLVSVFPGFKNNRSFMETMMGVSESLPPDALQELVRPMFEETLWERVKRLKVGATLLYYHFTIDDKVEAFFARFWKIYNEYLGRPYDRMLADEVLGYYQEIQVRMMKNWKVPIVNDFLTMIHFGLLKKLSGAWLAGLGEDIHNDLLSGEGGLESAEPTRKIVALAAMVAADEQLAALCESEDPESLYEIIRREPRFAAFNAEVADYLARFGFRCMGELKLESTDLNTDPSYLFVMIRNYLHVGKCDLGAFDEKEKSPRMAAERKTAEHLAGWRRSVFFWVLKHARKAVKNRENLRFARTRVFGLVRTMFRGLAEDLVRRGALDRVDDVFYLTVEELTAFVEGRCVLTDLRRLAALRKEEHARYREAEEPGERFVTRGAVYLDRSWDERSATQEESDLPPDTLKGLPCCPGTVEGIVKVVRSPHDDLSLSGEILATARTDPGWVPIYPSISGLLIERGSLLSHSAIVARELGLPTVIKVHGLLDKVASGSRVSVDGGKGIIRLLDPRAS